MQVAAGIVEQLHRSTSKCAWRRSVQKRDACLGFDVHLVVLPDRFCRWRHSIHSCGGCRGFFGTYKAHASAYPLLLRTGLRVLERCNWIAPAGTFKVSVERPAGPHRRQNPMDFPDQNRHCLCTQSLSYWSNLPSPQDTPKTI